MRKRADGRYCKQIVLGYTKDGKREIKNIYGKTIKEVEQKERKIRQEIEDGIPVLKNTIYTLKEWSIMWLNVYKKENSSYNTYNMYKNAIYNHIIPVLGDVYIKDLKTIQVQESQKFVN